MLDFFATMKEIRQIIRALSSGTAVSKFATMQGTGYRNRVYPELVRLPLKLYFYVPP